MQLTKAVASVICSMALSLSLLAQTRSPQPKYKDPRLPAAERAADLVSRMTLEEKVAQMTDRAPAIPRLDVPAYNWWNEALHGVARAGIATVFPQAIGLAATWNTDLMFRVADAISTEARAKHHDAVRRGDTGRYKGLTFWSPNINIFRDPRWGRGQETYGEDPYLTARLGVQFVRGLQGDDPRYLKVVATPKHYAVHSGPEPERHRFDAITDRRDLYETYLPAFEATVREAGAHSVMCAYNRYLGEACCASPALLKKILRDDWGFDGFVVSDCGAINDINAFHKLTGSVAESSALSVKSGTDLSCGQEYRTLVDAVKRGLVSAAEIDTSLKRLFTARFKLGMFDPPERVPYARIPISENDSPAHRELALEAARQSIVLLKNEGLLPLNKAVKKIAVVGPTADDPLVLLGNYNGTPSRSVTLLAGIRNHVSPQTAVVFEQGCNLVEAGAIYRKIPSAALSADGKAGLKGEYFDNRNLDGRPVLTRTDAEVDFNWGEGHRVAGLKDSEFSIRWTGRLRTAAAGEHRFAVTGDDGYRLWVDGHLVVDNWTTHASETRSGAVRLAAGRDYDLRLEYFQGGGGADIRLEWATPDDPAGRALAAAADAEVVIFAGGITPRVEGEEMNVPLAGFRGGDRTDIGLPKVQEDLLKALRATGKPVVLVLTGGSAITVNWASENLPAIVKAWYPGEEGGTALADVLFGDTSPAGRLPVTVYKSNEQLPPFEDYRMANRTYRYFTGEPLYRFGHGLSYTRFAYRNLVVPRRARTGTPLTVSVRVTNTGKMAGDEVVQLYVKDLQATVPVPLRSLQGFKRIRLRPGQSQVVRFTLAPRQLSLIDGQFKRVVEPGEFEISVGGAQPGAAPPTTEVLTAKVTLAGATFAVR